MSTPLPFHPVLTLAVARQVAAAAEAEAVARGWTVVIAVVDAAARLVLLQRLDGTMPASIDLAIAKAVSAATFRRPTKAFEEALVGGRQAILGLAGAVPVAGGVPLCYRGEMVGAIGVSGVKADEDAQVAEAGATVMSDLP
jgi:uncharacterized protein GlcG (DUF336 family)